MRKGPAIFWSIFVAAAVVRFGFSFVGEAPDGSFCVKNIVHGTGMVSEDPMRNETGQVLVVSVDEIYNENSKPCETGTFLKIKTKLYPRFSYGDQIFFTGKLSEPYNFGGDTGRSFDYKGYLAKDDIFYEIKSAEVATTSGSSANFIGINSVLFSLKRNFVGNLERALGEPHAALAAGLVVGEKSALGKGLLDDFRTTGLIHIVVLSGFNIAIVAVAMRRILIFLPRVWGIALGGIGIALFGILVGGGATVIRSCFMAVVALMADIVRRDYSVGRALAFAGLIMLIENPLILLHDPSFQLSFLATLGLILLAQPIEEKLAWITERFGARSIVATTLTTQIFVSPFILHMMGQVSVIGLIANIVVLPLIPITMLFVFLTGAFGFIHELAAIPFGWISHLLLSYELFIVENLADVPFASLSFPPFSFWWVIGFYISVGVAYYLYLFNIRRRLSNGEN